MTLVDQIRLVAEAYATARGLSESRVSTLAFGDGQKLTKLREGADLNTRRFEITMQWFSDNWPAGTAWPKGVKRPAQREAAA